MPRPGFALAAALAFAATPAARLYAAPADGPVDDAIALITRIGGKAVVDDRLDAEAQVAATFTVGADRFLFAVSKLPAVGAVTIDDAGRCTEAGFAALKELPDLQKLVLGKCTLTDKTTAAIAAIRPLQTLYLGGAKVTDVGLAGFKGHKHLKTLDLSDTKVTDKGLDHLKGLLTLEELNLSGTKVSDAGTGPLKELTGLKLLRLNNTNVTRAGITALESALPKATIRW